MPISQLYLDDKEFKKRVANSFIPYSESLAQAWHKLGGTQEAWGTECADAVANLDAIIQIKPQIEVKQLYLLAGRYRAMIEKKLRGNDKYAQSRFKNAQAVMYTLIDKDGRYRDQLNEGLHFITELSNNPGNRCEHSEHYFFVPGHPDATDESQQHMLMVEAFLHYLNYKNPQGESKRLNLTCVRKYQWMHATTHEITTYFDMANSYARDNDEIFQYIQEQHRNVWGNTKDLSDNTFYEKLADLMWIFAQVSPLENGSASTSEIIMKQCLINRFGKDAPLFFKPGISWDILAMLTTQKSYRSLFRNMLIKTPPTNEEVQKAYNIPLPQETSQRRNDHSTKQLRTRNNKTDLDMPSPNENLFTDKIRKRVLTVELQNVSALINTVQHIEQTKENNISRKGIKML